MDPLSDVLSLLKLRSYVSGGFDAAGDWAVQFGRHEGIKFHAILSGACWLSVDGELAPVKVSAGECFLLAHGKPFRLATNLDVVPVDVRALLAEEHDGRIMTCKGGGEFFSIGGYFTLADGQPEWLLDMLPAVVHIRNELGPQTLRWCIERMQQELRDPQPGGFLVAQQLASMVLVDALRLQLADREDVKVGWLSALADKRMRAAINAMHEAPERRWTLHDMARQAAMSRTVFALKFKELVGVSPMEYLRRWRMTLAADRLIHSRETLSAIGLALGYESEKSFSTAFKRVMKCSPRQYGKQNNAGSAVSSRSKGAPVIE